MNLKRISGVAATVAAAAAITIALFNGLPSSAAGEAWISIDANELETVKREAKGKLDKYDIDVAAVMGGIAIARINETGLETLSAGMHEIYNKCSGYIVHESENQALEDIERLFSVDPNQRLVDYTIDNQANVNQLIPETSETRVRQTIIDLSSYPTRRHDQPSAQQSAQYIKNIWDAMAANRSDISVAFFNHPVTTTPQPSVILTIQGTTLPNEVIVLGAHQDSIRSGSTTGTAPGADDDASGVASITEVIKVLVDKNFHPQRTVKFMAYAAEEVGLRGSRGIATDYFNSGVNVIGAIQFDMTNFKGNSNVDFAFESNGTWTNAAQNTFAKSLVTTYLPTLNAVDTSCGYGCSDHLAWHEKGFPASFPFEAPFNQHNSALHTVNDTLATSGGNANHAVKFSKLGLAYVGELAKGSILVANPHPARFDFDGDNRTDLSIFRPGAGEWWYLRSSDGGHKGLQAGLASDAVAPADFTGDGKADVAFFRQSTGEWFIVRSEDDSFYAFPFGTAGDIPVPGDFDGDGKSDPAVFRPSNSTWYILRSTGGVTFQTFGTGGDRPIVEDYDGDGKDDIAIFRPSNSQWWQFRSQAGVIGYQFGTSGDKALPADYTGDGKADIAVWRPSNGFWYILRSENVSFYSVPFGISTDLPTPGDYDGDGKADTAVFRPSDSFWYVQGTTSGFFQARFGQNADKPLPNTFVVE